MNARKHLAALVALLPVLLAATPAPDAPLADLAVAMRCAAVFGIAEADRPAAQPARFGQRGREFFVQVAARLMDEQHLSREQTAARLQAEVAAVRAQARAASDPAAAFDAAVRPCAALLDATIPAASGARR